MATIKEMALQLGLSPSTVSIVLAGRGNERKITPETQQRVLALAQKLSYRPSIAARTLRSGSDGEESLVVAVFWADDFRAGMMVRFLRGLRQGINSCKRPIRLLLFTYTNGQLCLEQALQSRTECHAAIVCNASANDQEFLEQTELPVPIVLYNRHSEKYATINVDDFDMGAQAAQALADNGCHRVSVLTSEPVYSGMSLRTKGFEEAAARRGMEMAAMCYCENSLPGGFDALISLKPDQLPDGLFCGSDGIALGVLRALWEKRVSIPNDIRIVSIGNSDRDTEEYAIPSLSTVFLPMENMAAECLYMLLRVIEGSEVPPCSRKLPVHYIQRESCGPLKLPT